jgi:metal-sulfur cluster biosynthetic enzyme
LVERLDELVDEETTRKFGELNIVTDVSETASGSFKVKFRPLSAYSPLAVDIGKNIRAAALSVEGVKAVRVECGGHLLDDLVNRIVNGESPRARRSK